MLALEVNAFLGEIARARSGYGPPQAPHALPDHRSFRRDGPATHVVLAPRLVEAVLGAHETFLQADFHAAISAVDRESAWHWVRYFISHNPIQHDGPAHKASREAFLTVFADVSRRLDGAWREMSAANVAEFAQGHIASPAEFARLSADRFIEAVIGLHAPGLPAGALVDADKPSAKSVFGYLHSPARLAAEEASLVELVGAMGREGAGPDGVMPMLLSLIVQGRDPMVGTMAAFLNHLLALEPDQRRAEIAGASPREVFRKAASVNYTGRRAAAAFARDGLDVMPGDAVLVILPPLNGSPNGPDLSFGHGAHRCAGKALAYQMLGIWLDGLRKSCDSIPWQSLVADRRMPGVFEEYRAA
ncbi:MAG: hypothetical protein ACO1OK_05045 [Devosia sp.]